jgi:hypothetical protein
MQVLIVRTLSPLVFPGGFSQCFPYPPGHDWVQCIREARRRIHEHWDDRSRQPLHAAIPCAPGCHFSNAVNIRMNAEAPPATVGYTNYIRLHR